MLSKIAILLCLVSLTSCLLKTKISYQSYNAVNPSLLDSLKCNLEETNSIVFENSLKQKTAVTLGLSTLPIDSNRKSITYLTYNEPSAKFLIIRVVTDSLYHFFSYVARQNFCDENEFKGISRKYIDALRQIDYSAFFYDTTFYLDYCYVTDRVDKIIVLRTKGVFISGVNTHYFEGMNLPRQKYGLFDKLGDALYQKLRFR